MFLLEYREILDRIQSHLHTWRAEGVTAPMLAVIGTEFQALKNSAVAAGFDDVATLGSNVEKLIAQAAHPQNTETDFADDGLLSLLEEVYDGLSVDLDFVPTPAREHVKFLNSMACSLLLTDRELVERDDHHLASAASCDDLTATSSVPSLGRPSPSPTPFNRQLTELISMAEECRMNNLRIEHLLADIQPEFDASQRDSKQSHSLTSLEWGASINAQTSVLQCLLNDTHTLGEHLHDKLLNVRMCTAGDYLPWLLDTALITAKKNNKSVELSLHGGEVKVDRRMMDCMKAPLDHLIQYSIESSIGNTNASQSESGHIRISITQQGTTLVIDYTDDGHGFDKRQIAAYAVSLGMTESTDQVTDEHLLQIITQPADADSANRAANITWPGMDKVYHAVRELGGCMAMKSEYSTGLGVQFCLPCPPLQSALMIDAGGYPFVIPTHKIERLLSLHQDNLLEEDGRYYVNLDTKRIPVVNLANQLGAEDTQSASLLAPLVLLRLVDRIVAFQVDKIRQLLPISRKSESRLASLHGVADIAVLLDSTSVAILDPDAFIDRSTLCSDALNTFPLIASHTHTQPSSSKNMFSVVVLESESGIVLVPAGMVAGVVGAEVCASLEPHNPRQHDWLYGDLQWHGLKVPAVNIAHAVDANTQTECTPKCAIILWPMKDCNADHFFALFGLEQLTTMEINTDSITLLDKTGEAGYILGRTWIDQRMGIIPDLKKLSHRIFSEYLPNQSNGCM